MKKLSWFVVTGVGLWSFCGVAVDWDAQVLKYCKVFAQRKETIENRGSKNFRLVQKLPDSSYVCSFQLGGRVYTVFLGSGRHTQEDIIGIGAFEYPDGTMRHISITRVETVSVNSLCSNEEKLHKFKNTLPHGVVDQNTSSLNYKYFELLRADMCF